MFVVRPWVVGAVNSAPVFDPPVTLDTSAGSTVFGYDGRGNRTSATNPSGTITYGYATANRLTTGSDGSAYTFTGDNLRASAQSAGNGPVLDWVWDTTSEVPALLSDGVREFVYGSGGLALSDQPIAGSTGGDPAVFLHPDGFGSVRSATKAAGDEVSARSYDAYGADARTWSAPGFTDTTGTHAQPNGLTGLHDGAGNAGAADSASTYDPAFATRWLLAVGGHQVRLRSVLNSVGFESGCTGESTLPRSRTSPTARSVRDL